MSVPFRVEEVLEKVLHLRGLKQKLDQYSFFSYWQDIMGELLAKVTYPDRISKQTTLVIRVINSTWCQQLSLSKKEILARIQHLAPQSVIEDIRFEVGNPLDFAHTRNPAMECSPNENKTK